MGKVRNILISATLCASCCNFASAQDVKLSDFYDLMPWMKIIHEYAPVTFDIITHLPGTTDFATNQAILEATGIQMAIESRTNALTDSLAQIQSKTAAMTTTTYAIQQNYEQAMTSTSEFEEGTRFYDYVMETLGDVVTEGDELDRILRRSKVRNKSTCQREIDNLKQVARGLVNNYIEIVTNGKAKGEGGSSVNKDGYNSMSRMERLDAVKEIGAQLRAMRGMIRYLSRALLACEDKAMGDPENRKIDFMRVGVKQTSNRRDPDAVAAEAARWFNTGKK